MTYIPVRFTKAFQYSIACFASVCFWGVYYYFSNRHFGLAVSLAVLDTAQYLAGYLVTTQLFLRFLSKKKVRLFFLCFLALIIVIGLSRTLTYHYLTILFKFPPFTLSASTLIYLFTTTTFTLLAVSGIRVSLDWMQSQKEIEEINKERIHAELEFLKGQLNPHFLFNSLNTLYGSIHADNEAARNILLKLSDMLRYQLYECNTARVSIRKELEYINNYIMLQKLRNSESLDVKVNVDHELFVYEIPPLLISPLIENAFKYVSKTEGRKNWISFEMKKDKDRLVVCVRNSISPVEVHTLQSGGIGIANIEKRLNLMYGKEYSLNIEKEDQAFNVTLMLALHENKNVNYRR